MTRTTPNSLQYGRSASLAKMSGMVGGGILTALRHAAYEQRFDQELESWKAEHPDDPLVTHDAEIQARGGLIEGIFQKYFQKEEPSCGDCADCSRGSCDDCSSG